MNRVFLKSKASLSTAFFILAVAVAVNLSFAAAPVSAGINENAAGFAWGGGAATNGAGYDGIGWVSFNNLSDGSAVGYGVNIPMTNGALSGYAWSEHYGWLSFNGADLAGCTPALSAATRTGNAITGGARILSIRDAGVNSGGWSGCVSLAGNAQDGSPYGVSVSPGNPSSSLSGYAWSDELGWISLSGVTFTAPITLKVCEGSFLRGINTTPSTAFSMPQGTTKDLTAYYGSEANCSGTDVTTNAGTSWNEKTGSSVISLSTVAGKKRLTAATPGNENFSASYNGLTATMAATVVCVASNTCAIDPNGVQVCQSETYTIADGCGNTVTCNGRRNCDYNWKEIAP